MKALIVADLHLRAKNLNSIAEAWAKVVKWAKDNVDYLLIAGDVFDDKNVFGKEEVVGTIYDAFLSPLTPFDSSWTKLKKVIAIPGNHDLGNPKDKSTLAPLLHYEWFQGIGQPKMVQLEPGFQVCAVPWVYTSHIVDKLMKSKKIKFKEAEEEALQIMSGMDGYLSRLVEKAKEEKNFVLLLGHLEVAGSKQSTGMLQTNGTFEFSASQLSEIGADAYALGHIHLRQNFPLLPNKNDGYVGSLCQLRFDEGENQVGCRLIEVVDGKIVDDRFIENKASPRYVVASTVEELKSKFREGVDFGWIKSQEEEKPQDLPEGVRFQKVPLKNDSQNRTGETLDPEMALETLLDAWAKAALCDVPTSELVKKANEISSQIKLPGDTIGSLTKLNFIKLTNIAHHLKTSVDLSQINGLCGIEGPNGSGKTTFIESLFVALYGDSPSRPNLASLVSTGQSKAKIEFGFESSGQNYVVQREFKKTENTFSQKASLSTEDQVVAGPKIDPVNKECSRIVGEKQMIRTGIFSSQENSSNLMEMRPAERKDVFAKLLGTEKFLEFSDVAKKESNGLSARIEMMDDSIKKIDQELLNEEADKDSGEKLKEEINSAKIELKKAQNEMSDIDIQIANIEKEIEERRSKLEEKSSLEKKKQDIITEGRNTKKRLTEIEGIDPEEIKRKLESARGARKKRDDVEKKINELNSKYQQACLEAERFTSKAQGMEVKFSEEFRLYESDLNSRSSLIQKEVATTDSELKVIQNNLSEAIRRASILKGYPGEKICNSCCLAKDGIESKNSIPLLEKKKIDLEGKIREAQKKQKSIEDERVSFSDFNPEKRKEIEEIKKQARSKAPEKPNIDDLEKLKRNFDDEAVLVEALETKLSEAQTQKNEAEGLASKLKDLRSKLEDIEKALAKIVVKEIPDQSRLKNDRSNIEIKIENINSSLSEKQEKMGAIKEKMSRYETIRNEKKELLGKVEEGKSTEKVLGHIAKAFGRDGIPQMIVDSMLPRFQETMTGLLEACDGKWSIVVKSQRETKSGSIQETIDILVDDGYGLRDISTYSGGEKKILNNVARLAFAIMQAERSGKGLKVLVLDEATDMMDHENTESFFDMIQKLPQYFNQVFIVAHNARTLSSLPTRLSFTVVDNSVEVKKV